MKTYTIKIWHGKTASIDYDTRNIIAHSMRVYQGTIQFLNEDKTIKELHPVAMTSIIKIKD